MPSPAPRSERPSAAAEAAVSAAPSALGGLPVAEGAGPCLRRLPGRAVWREGPVLVKGFAAGHERRPGIAKSYAWTLGAALARPFASPRARWRAAREDRALRTLGAAGLAVPHSRGLERRPAPDGRVWWCLVTEWIPDAPDLERWFSGGAHPRRGRAAARLGRLVAQLADAGVWLDDLHPGNLLLDADGTASACDLRLGRGRRSLEDSLARLGGRALAHTGARERARFALSFLRACRAPAGDAASKRAWLIDLEARLPAARAADVEHDLDRWLRPSGRLRTSSDGRWMLAAGDSPALELDLEGPGPPAPCRYLLLEGTGQHVHARWLAQARAWESGWSPIRPQAIQVVALSSRPRPGPARAWLCAPAPLRAVAPETCSDELKSVLQRARALGAEPGPVRCFRSEEGQLLLLALPADPG